MNDFSENIVVNQGIYISNVLWIITVSLVKLSILLFYWPLFSSSKQARLAVYLVSTSVILWMIAVVRA